MSTEEWNKLTSVLPNKDKMREYDGLIGLTLLNLYSMSKELKTIRLFYFHPENKEHLFVLRVALIARDLYGFPVEVELSWFKTMLLNWKIRKGFSKVKRIKKNEYCGIWVSKFLEFMRPDGVQRLGKDFSFADIYETYYEGSCG